MRLLLVEDDPLIGDAIKTFFSKPPYQFSVDWLTDGQQGLDALLSGETFGLVILDLGLPKLGGLELLKTIRANGITTPVIVLTAKDHVDDRIKGLDTGANHYMVKPFHMKELAAQIQALLRNQYTQNQMTITIGEVTLDPSAYQVNIQGQPVTTSRREFAMLLKLMSSSGKVVSRDALIQALYTWDDEIDSNTIEVHIHNIRKKLGDHLTIRTIRGVGYIIDSAC